MSVDRDRLEQEAVRLLGKGQSDRALEKYLTILRAFPRERRIRQKVAELYLQAGETSKAEKQFKEVAKQMVKAGQQRAAINIYKQLVRIKPEDIDNRRLLGECLLEEGFENEAVKCFTECMEKSAARAPDEAIEFCEMLIKMSPGDFSLRIQKAEYIEKANWSEAAATEWYNLAQESRRLGRPGEATRFLEFSLRLRGERPKVLIEAAEGQLVQGDVKRALQHLQHAHKRGGPSGKVFGLLGACFQALNQQEKAQKLWLQAAKAYSDEGNDTDRAMALGHAIECGASDASTRDAYQAAKAAAARLALRLHEQDWAKPKSSVEGVPVVQAETMWKYGFADRALTLLDGLEEPARSSIPVRVRVAELWAQSGDIGSALQELRLIQPSSEAASEHIWTRMAILSGDEEDEELIEDEADDDLIDEDEDGPSETIDSDQLMDEDDGLDAGAGVPDEPDLIDEDEDLFDDDEDEVTDPGLGSKPGPAIDLEDDPLDFGSDFGSETLGSSSSTDFGSIFGASQDEQPIGGEGVRQAPGSEGLSDVRGWLALGQFEKALVALDGKQGLESEVWRALAKRMTGDSKAAFNDLRDAVDEATESDPFFPEALMELARLAALSGKGGAARRLLRQLGNLHPGFRVRDVADIQHALTLMSDS